LLRADGSTAVVRRKCARRRKLATLFLFYDGVGFVNANCKNHLGVGRHAEIEKVKGVKGRVEG